MFNKETKKNIFSFKLKFQCMLMIRLHQLKNIPLKSFLVTL